MQQGNDLGQGFGGQPAATPVGLSPATPQQAPSPSPMMAHLGGLHSIAEARYDKLSKAEGTLAKVRAEMDKLLALRDTVSEDDVIDAAAGLVAAGLTAGAVAGLLSNMPEAPQALEAWVAKHDQDVQQREAQLQQQLVLARHEMGVSAMRALIGHSAESGGGAQAPQQAQPQPAQGPEPPSLSSNPLAPPGASDAG